MSTQKNKHSESDNNRKNKRLKRDGAKLNRKTKGLLSQLTEEQRNFLLNYDGEEISGCFYNRDLE